MNNIEALCVLTLILYFGFAVLACYVSWLRRQLGRAIRVVNTANINKLQSQLDCLSAGGHYYEFVKVIDQYWEGPDPTWHVQLGDLVCPVIYYLFRCECGHKKAFSWDELSVAEQRAITALGLGGE